MVVESLEWSVRRATSNRAFDSSFDLRSAAVVAVAFAVASASCCGDCCHSTVIDAEAIVGAAAAGKVTS